MLSVCLHPRHRSHPRIWGRGLMVVGMLALAACQGTLGIGQTPPQEHIPSPGIKSQHGTEDGIKVAPAIPFSEGGVSGVEPLSEDKVRPQYRDLWQRMRVGMKVPTVSGKSGTRLLQHQRWYEANSKHLASVFNRAQRYLFDIVEQVEGQGLPMEIALLPAVESAFMPNAHSSAAADGLWQFIAPTGRRFNLKQHMFQDDRRNVRAATQAALRYLTELQVRYNGDYQLALAAYNCGEGCVDAAIRRARARGLEGRFEDLTLNNETANYVPRLLALTQLVARAVDEGSSTLLPQVANAPYYVAVPISRDIDVRLAAELAGMPLDDFRSLNSQHKKPVIVAASNVDVLVPIELEATFIEAMARYRGPLATWSTAVVSRRTPVEALARQHGANTASLQEVNHIPKGHLVAAGSTIVVPRPELGHDIPANVAEAATLATVPAMVRAKVRVHKKESWSGLAQRLGVKASQLQGWNPTVKRLRAGTLALSLPIDLAERLISTPPAASHPTARIRRE